MPKLAGTATCSKSPKRSHGRAEIPKAYFTHCQTGVAEPIADRSVPRYRHVPSARGDLHHVGSVRDDLLGVHGFGLVVGITAPQIWFAGGAEQGYRAGYWSRALQQQFPGADRAPDPIPEASIRRRVLIFRERSIADGTFDRHR